MRTGYVRRSWTVNFRAIWVRCRLYGKLTLSYTRGLLLHMSQVSWFVCLPIRASVYDCSHVWHEGVLQKWTNRSGCCSGCRSFIIGMACILAPPGEYDQRSDPIICCCFAAAVPLLSFSPLSSSILGRGRCR